MYLDSTNIEEINQYIDYGIIKGITTNPTLLLKEEKERMSQLKNISKTNIDTVFVQIVGDNLQELWNDYIQINELIPNNNFSLKVPLNFPGLAFIKKIKEEEPGKKVLGTAIYSADQGIIGAISGCDYLAPYVNRMSNNNLDPYEVIKQIRTFIDQRGLKTEIMGASFKNSNQIINSLMAGAHTATIPPNILDQMVNKELATNAIEVFNNHGKELANKFKK